MDEGSLDAMLKYLESPTSERPKLRIDERGNSELHASVLGLKSDEVAAVAEGRPQCLFMLNDNG